MTDIQTKPIGELQSQAFYENDPIFKRIQWEMRAGFEEAWRMAGGDAVQSPHNQEPAGWRLAWMNSKAREFLVVNGMISGKDMWR